MQAYRVETSLQQDGSVILRNLPLKAGEAVEVIVLVRTPSVVVQDRYPLRGTPITYRDPLAPVGDADWEAAE